MQSVESESLKSKGNGRNQKQQHNPYSCSTGDGSLRILGRHRYSSHTWTQSLIICIQINKEININLKMWLKAKHLNACLMQILIQIIALKDVIVTNPNMNYLASETS